LEFGTTGSILIAAGRLLGLTLQLTLLVQLILISRLPLIEKPFGFDSLNHAHRIIGYVLLASIVFHPALLILGYALSSGVPLTDQFLEFFREWPEVPDAVLALGLFVAAGVASIPFIRKALSYGRWHVSHLLMYAAVGLAFEHQFNSEDLAPGAAYRYWYVLNYAVFGILILFRFLRPFLLYARHRFFVERVVPETDSVTSVYIGGRAMDRFTFEPGQYVHVSFLKRGLLEPHPFSLSAAPDGKNLRLSIKASGDYTSRIRPLLAAGTKVLLEGPFGRFTERAAEKEKYLFVAGGIGITPIRSMLEHLMKKDADAVLLYGSRTPEEIVFDKELDALGVRRYDIFSHASPDGAETGHIDEDKVKRLVPDLLDRDVYLCGPPVMTQKLVETFRHLGVPRSRLHFEKFSY